MTTPFGRWPSPYTPENVSGAARRLGTVRCDSRTVYFVESAPDGRGVLMRWEAGALAPVTAQHRDGRSVNVGSRVHEYGGPDFTVADGTVVFSERSDGRLYLMTREEDGSYTLPVPVTADDGARFADLTLRERVVYAVMERHGATITNTVVAVDLTTGAVHELVAGPDFVANPIPSPLGGALAWYEWDHPAMPWTATRLCVAELDGLELGQTRCLTSGRTSAISPVWLREDELVFVDDASGWWNVYRAQAPLGEARVRPVHPAEVDMAAAPWQLDSSLTPLDADHVVVRFTQAGSWHLGALRASNGEFEEWVTGWDPAGPVAVGDGVVAYVASRSDQPSAVVALDLQRGKVSVVRRSSDLTVPEEYLSLPEALTWDVADGAVAHGFFYPPVSPNVTATDEALPPLLVMVHGGPTSATSTGFDPGVQFWTTRGFAVLDVDYRGSTGYGRAYRQALDGAWGVADIADIAAGVRSLADRGLIDPARVAIRGGSAGGYTVLRALTSTDTFAAGMSRYGIADLALLAADTHKFESHYTDSLVGPWPEAAAVYAERSPLSHLDRLTAPLLLLQGGQDKVVPPEQAIRLADELRARGADVELVIYPDEGHGWRQEATKRDALARELAFYQRVLG